MFYFCDNCKFGLVLKLKLFFLGFFVNKLNLKRDCLKKFVDIYEFYLGRKDIF